MQIKDFLNIQYMNRGRSFLGVDCYGLVYLYYKKVLGIKLLSFKDEYEDAEDRKGVSEVLKRNKTEQFEEFSDRSELKINDVIIFSVGGAPRHTGLYIGDNKFLHTMKSIKFSCVEKLDSPVWNKRILGYFRYVGNINE